MRLRDRRQVIAKHARLAQQMPMRTNGRPVRCACQEDSLLTMQPSLSHQVQRNVQIVQRERLMGTQTQVLRAHFVMSEGKTQTPNQSAHMRVPCAHRACGHTEREWLRVWRVHREPTVVDWMA